MYLNTLELFRESRPFMRKRFEQDTGDTRRTGGSAVVAAAAAAAAAAAVGSVSSVLAISAGSAGSVASAALNMPSSPEISPPPASSSSNCPLPSAKPHKANQTLNGSHSPHGDGGGNSPSPPQAAGANNPAKSSSNPEQFTLAAAAVGPNVRQISKLKRFLTTLYQFACDNGPEVGERVHTLVTGLVNSALTIEDFHQKIQDITHYPLRPYVVPFLRLHLPILQNEIMHFARLAKLTPAQYIRQHESLILDTVSASSSSSSSSGSGGSNSLVVGEPFEIFQPPLTTSHHHEPPLSTIVSASTTATTAVSSAMGVKEQQSGKRRLSPEGRGKESSLSPEDRALADGGPPAKRHQPLVSPSLTARLSPAGGSAPALITVHTPVTSGSGGSHHPHHHHHSSVSGGGGGQQSASLLHSHHHLSGQARAAALCLEAERERADQRHERLGPSSLYHTGNGVSSGHRDGLSNGHRGGVSNGLPSNVSAPPDHFERERYAIASERYEKEYFSRSAPMFYSELQRSYAEELSRDMEEEWKNIYTMLNCILGMVEKTKRALNILQHRSLEQVTTSMWSPPGRPPRHFPPSAHEPGALDYLKKARNDHHGPAISHYQKQGSGGGGGPAEVERLSAAVSEALRRPRPTVPTSLESVNEVKRQAVAELQKAVTAAESKASELVAVERAKMDRMLVEARRQAAEDALTTINRQEDNTENCWNCGRKANETCSGCSLARYCGAFCQHKDWENHHRICGRTGGGGQGSDVGLSGGGTANGTNGNVSPVAMVEVKRSKSSPSPGSGGSNGSVGGGGGAIRSNGSTSSLNGDHKASD